MRLILAFAITFSISIVLPAQDDFQVVLSVPLPDEIKNKFGWADLRVGCGEDGTVLLPMVPEGEGLAHTIVGLATNGAYTSRIDLQAIAGFGESNVEDFAAAPRGQIYILARPLTRDKNREGSTVGLFSETLWLLRFDATGSLLSKAPLLFRVPDFRLAVFPSGAAFIVGYTCCDGFCPYRPLVGIFSQDGKLLRTVNLPEAVLGHYRDPRRGAPVPVPPVPMLGSDGNVYVVRSGDHPALSVVTADGTVLRTVNIAVPKNGNLEMPRINGNGLIAHLASAKSAVRQRERAVDVFAEFDTQTGAMLALHRTPRVGWKPVCALSSSAMSFYNGPDGTLDIVQPSSHRDQTKP